MRKLLSLLVAAVLLPVAANADILKNVKLTGEIQTIASDVKTNADYLNLGSGATWYNSGAKTRALAGLSFDVVEDVTANVLFQYAYNWGDNNYTNNGFSNGEGAKLVNANVVLHNLFCNLEVTVGRQFYGEDGSPIIYFGPNHYNAEGMGLASALDAVVATYGDDVKTLTLVAGKVADLTNGTLATPDKAEVRSNIFGGDFKLNVTDALTANLYGYDFTGKNIYDYSTTPAGITPLGGDEIKHMGVYGGKLGLTTDAFRASAEYARNFSGHRLVKDHKDTPYMVKADIAADIKAVTARGTFLYAKNNPDGAVPFSGLGNYAPGLLMGHRLSAGLMESIFTYDVTGIRMFNVGFDVKPAEKWTVSLDGYSFQSRDGHHTTYEADLTAKYAHNEYVELFAGIGYAKYGNATNYFAASMMGADTYKNTFGSENYKGQLGMLVRF